MNIILSSNTRALLARSLPAVEAGKNRLRLALRTSLARSERDPELSDTPDTIAALLLGFLVEQVQHLTASGEPSGLERHRSEHRLHGFDGRHYSRFGDVLVPVLRDTLGPSHPRAFASAWSDAFWAILQRMQQGDAPNAAPQASRIAEMA